ncbi:tripartite tricarboxylate transporter TctB family protein [Streptomyces sp. HNM0574]|uniref:tripartite tricarboxylate transporter TctB family protein n=1 Tax=Streptomyces sp. HNM0574 TaxID=2714954 RepID=UPI003217B0F8
MSARGSGANGGAGDAGPPRERFRGKSELGVCALLLTVGVLVLTDALTMDVLSGQRGPVGPRTVPLVVGCALLVVAVVLAVEVLREAPVAGRREGVRGGRAAAEDSGGTPDEDGSGTAAPADWRTVALLAGIFLAFAALIEPLGFPLSGALLFWGSAYALGSRNLGRDPLIAAALSLVTYGTFNTLLGVPLPGGPLMGVI